MKKRQQSCAFKRIAVFLALILAAGMVGAYDGNLNGAGFGLASDASIGSSPISYTQSVGGNVVQKWMYFQLPGAGNYSLSIDLTTSYPGIYYGPGLNIYGLNYTSGGSAVWTIYYQSEDQGRRFVNITAYSNTGIFALMLSGYWNSGTLTIYPETSFYGLNGAPDYSTHSYTAGSSYIIPMVNRYYPQTTTLSFSDPLYGSPISASNYTAFYYTPFRSACDIPSGIESVTVFNVGPLDLTYQSFPISLNMTAIQSLNFTSFSDAPSTSIIANPGVAHNFSFTINHPEAVTGVSWFLDGGMVSTGNAYNTAYTFNQSITGVYNLEVFVDDINCGRYIYARWYINVGQLINLIGTIRDINSNLPIQYANVILQSVPLSYLSSSLTDSAGSYSFSGLAAGNYNLTVGADGYNSYNTSFALAYGSQNTTTYRKDYSLAATYSIGDWTLQAIDHDTFGGVSGYNLSVFWSGVKVLEVRNGVQVYKAYYYYFNTTYDGSSFSAYITQLPIGYTYTAKIDKAGYVSWPYLLSPATVSRTFTALNPSYTDQVYLKTTATTTTTTPSTTTSTTMPVCHGTESNTCYAFDGNQTGCLNAFVIFFGGIVYNCVYDSGPGHCDVDSVPCGAATTTTTTSTTTTTRPPIPSGSCVGNYTDFCFTFDDNQAACVVHFVAYGDFGYQCFYDAGTGYCDFNSTSCEYVRPTTTTLAPGTTTTTRKPTTTLAPTTTTTSPPTTIHQWNGSHVPVTANCTDLLVQLNAGDWFHPAMCAYIIPLGTDWAYGLLMLMVVLFSYKITNTWVGPGILALFISSMFYLYLPQPTLTVLALGVIFGLGSLFYSMFFEFAKQKDKN